MYILYICTCVHIYAYIHTHRYHTHISHRFKNTKLKNTYMDVSESSIQTDSRWSVPDNRKLILLPDNTLIRNDSSFLNPEMLCCAQAAPPPTAPVPWSSSSPRARLCRFPPACCRGLGAPTALEARATCTCRPSTSCCRTSSFRFPAQFRPTQTSCLR